MSPNNREPEELYFLAVELWGACLRSPILVDTATAADVARYAREWADFIAESNEGIAL